MDVFSEIEIEALIEEALANEQALAPESLVSGDVIALESELDAITTFLDGTQNFDPFEPEWLDNAEYVTPATNSDIANWLTAFIDGDAAVASDDKAVVTFIEDTGGDEDEDDGDPGIISWGTWFAINVGDLGDYSLGNTNIAVYDGDANTGLDGTPDGDVDDEVIAVGQRQTPPDISIIRGPVGSGTFTYIFGDLSFDNEAIG